MSCSVTAQLNNSGLVNYCVGYLINPSKIQRRSCTCEIIRKQDTVIRAVKRRINPGNYLTFMDPCVIIQIL